MKKIQLLPVLAALMFLAGCEKERVMASNDVPQEIQSYVETHFSSNKILQTLKDTEGLTLTYDVTLDSAISLEFNRSKEIISIDANSKLPDSVIPQKILTYVLTNYPNQVITDWEKESRKVQQIELNNGLDLEFDEDGNYLRIDN